MTDKPPFLSTGTDDHTSLSTDMRRLSRLATARKTLTVQEMLDLFGRDGFIVLQIFLAILTIVLSPLPGQSTVFGSVMVAVSWAIIRGYNGVRLPAKIGRTRMPARHITKGVNKTRRLYYASAKFLKARPSGVPSGIVNWAIMLMSIIILAPIPFGNTLASVAVILLGIGQAERDGVWLWAGMALALLHVALPIWGLHYMITHYL
ncbi:MAG: exopolysaccharide biosynthesis protein [Pseudomonadota bacterium]